MNRNLSSLADSVRLTNKVSNLYRKRTDNAQERFATRTAPRRLSSATARAAGQR